MGDDRLCHAPQPATAVSTANRREAFACLTHELLFASWV
jgi:hypothetical protein